MNRTTKASCITIGLIIIILGILVWRAILFWEAIPLQQKTKLVEIFAAHYGYIILGIALIAVIIILGVLQVINVFILPVRQLIEETNLISAVNPEHRITPPQGKHNKLLAKSINELADRFSSSQKSIESEISLSKAEVEREKNILATFIGELHEAVLICNAEGSIMFYNKRAKELFAPRDDSSEASENTLVDEDNLSARVKETFVGIGRSIFKIIDKNLIVHALDEVASKLHHSDSYVASSFVVATRAGILLRVETVPVLNKKLELSGFVFSANDITEPLRRDNRLDELIQSLIKNIRASVGGIRSSIDTILTYPDMEKDQLERFQSIIHHECISLGRIVEKAVVNYPDHLHTRWPLVPVPTAELIEKVRRKAGNTLGVSLYIEKSEKGTWIKVESYCAIMIILFVLNQLKDETNNLDFFCKIEKGNKFINIDISWKGNPVMIKTLRSWDKLPLKIRQEGLDLTLQEVLGHHGGNLWLLTLHDHDDRSALRIIFPECEHMEPEKKGSIAILTEESRPVFYDFDLLQQQNKNSLLENRLLTDLEYTVFDTETTGLEPRGGDEIISIGAVRVINGQILQDELFDQMVDPKRDIPISSTHIHGIQTDMVQGKPTIEVVLPSFYDFCDLTVLVAHNAAFDMLMLKLNEKTTGLKFVNPVLDTLLLWDILHPAQERNNFTMIAEMLGVRIVGRHTALGDALTTAEAFCKMIPLLAQKGIYTLKDAMEASQRSKYARLKY